MRIYLPQATKPIPEGAKINRDKGIVTYKVHGKTRRAAFTVTTKGERMRVETKTWHIAFRDGEDRQQDLAAFTLENPSRLLAGQIQKLLDYYGQPIPSDLRDYCEKLPREIADALRACGLLPPEEQPAPEQQPLGPMVDAFEAWLRNSKGKSGYHRNETHIGVTLTRIRNIVSGCAFGRWADVTPAQVETYLGGLNIEPGTYNGYVVAIKHFCEWCVRQRLLTSNPLVHLDRIKASDKETRRPLDTNEIKPLLLATLTRGRRYSIEPLDRAVLYVVGLVTGFRRKELSWLTPESFKLDRAFVELDKDHTKDHRDATQPIPIALVEPLRVYLADKRPKARLWHPITMKTAEMIQEDAKAAGLTVTDNQGRELVFHSLRHSLRTWLVRAKVVEAVIDKLLRHKPPTNNTGRNYYTNLDDSDLRTAIESLPSIPWPMDLLPPTEPTGTDGEDVTSESLREVYFQVTPHNTTSDNIGQGSVDSDSETALVSQNQGLDRTGCTLPTGNRFSQAVAVQALAADTVFLTSVMSPFCLYSLRREATPAD